MNEELKKLMEAVLTMQTQQASDQTNIDSLKVYVEEKGVDSLKLEKQGDVTAIVFNEEERKYLFTSAELTQILYDYLLTVLDTHMLEKNTAIEEKVSEIQNFVQ